MHFRTVSLGLTLLALRWNVNIDPKEVVDVSVQKSRKISFYKCVNENENFSNCYFNVMYILLLFWGCEGYIITVLFTINFYDPPPSRLRNLKTPSNVIDMHFSAVVITLHVACAVINNLIAHAQWWTWGIKPQQFWPLIRTSSNRCIMRLLSKYWKRWPKRMQF